MIGFSRIRDVGDIKGGVIFWVHWNARWRVQLIAQGVRIGEYRKLDQRWIREMNVETVVDVGANTRSVLIRRARCLARCGNLRI